MGLFHYYLKHIKMKPKAPEPQVMAQISEAVDLAYGTLGGIARPAHLIEVLDQFWPECAKSELTGRTLMRPADALRLEALFKLFGVPMLVQDNGLEIIARAYTVFGQALGLFVNHKLRFPGRFGKHETFREYLSEWDEDWVYYLEAVAAENYEEARKFAIKLNVLDPECVYPPNTFVPPLVPHPTEPQS